MNLHHWTRKSRGINFFYLHLRRVLKRIYGVKDQYTREQVAWAITSVCPKYSPYIIYAIYLFCSESEFLDSKKTLAPDKDRKFIQQEIKSVVKKGYFTGGHAYSGPAGQ